MAVIRVNKTKDYTVMSNHHLKDKRLSLKGKGLLSLMFSLPDDWDYSVEGLVAICKESKTTMQGILKEVEDTGYLVRNRIQNEKGQFCYEYIVYESPQMEEPQTEKPRTEKPHTVEPCTENQPQLNTNKSNTKNKRKQPFAPLISEYSKGNEEIESLLNDWLEVRKAKRAAMTERAIEMNLAKLDSLAAKSNMSVTEYLQEIICRGWAAFYVINNFGSKPEPKAEPKKADTGQLAAYMKANENKPVVEDASLYEGVF